MQSGLKLVVARNEFYKQNYRNMLCLNILLLVLLLGIGFFLIQQKVSEPTPSYFPATPDGKLIELTSVSEPIYSQEEIINWAKQAVVAIQSLDYVTYRKSLQEIRAYFTSKGHRRYLDAFAATNNLKTIRANKQVVSAKVIGPAKIIKEGLFRGHYAWKVTIPCRVFYENSVGTNFTQSLLATVTVLRVSVLANKGGIAINDLVLEATL